MWIFFGISEFWNIFSYIFGGPLFHLSIQEYDKVLKLVLCYAVWVRDRINMVFSHLNLKISVKDGDLKSLQIFAFLCSCSFLQLSVSVNFDFN